MPYSRTSARLPARGCSIAAVDLAQPRRASPRRWARMRADQLRAVSLGLERAREEQLEQALVAQLVAGAGLEQPARAARSRPAGVIEKTTVRRPPFAAAVALATRPFLLEALQLGIDLPVARGPEEARRLVDDPT